MLLITRRSLYFRFTGFFLILPCINLIYSSSKAQSDENQPVASVSLCTDQWLILFQDSSTQYYLSPMAPQKSYNYLYREVKKNQIIKPQLDALLTLKPSLVLAGSHTKKSLLHGLGNLGLSTVIIEPAYTFEGIRENLGKLLNQEKKAASLLREFDTRLDLLSDQSKGKPDQTAIFYAPNGFTHGRGTMYDAILSAAGLSNLAAELGIQGHGYISLETLLWYEPDIIILEDDFSENHSLSQQMLNHPALKRALLQSRLIYVNANKLRCPDFSSLLAVEQILEQR